MTTPSPRASSAGEGVSELRDDTARLPKALPEPDDISRSVDVPVSYIAARTPMNAYRQVLLDCRVACAAPLACSARIDLHHIAAGTLSLAHEDAGELSPRDIMYLLGKQPCRQALHVQILHVDRLVATHELERHLVMKVEALASDSQMLLAYEKSRLASPIRAPRPT